MFNDFYRTVSFCLESSKIVTAKSEFCSILIAFVMVEMDSTS